jgi:hypothetical protein
MQKTWSWVTFWNRGPPKVPCVIYIDYKKHLPKGALQDEGTRYIRPFAGWHPPHDPPQTADTLVRSGDLVKFIIRLPIGAPQDPHLMSSRNSSPVPERSIWKPPRRHSPNEKQSPPLPNFTGFPSEMANLKSSCFIKPFLGFTRTLLNLERNRIRYFLNSKDYILNSSNRIHTA